MTCAPLTCSICFLSADNLKSQTLAGSTNWGFRNLRPDKRLPAASYRTFNSLQRSEIKRAGRAEFGSMSQPSSTNFRSSSWRVMLSRSAEQPS